MKLIKILYFSVFLSLLLFSSCFGGNKTINIDKNSIIVSFGDSLTYGKGATAKTNYPSVLSGILGVNIINSGISGEITSAALLRIDSVIIKYKPNLVILMHGGNDLLRGIRDSVIESNLDKIISKLTKQNIKVILLSVPRASVLLRDAVFYKKLANKYNILLIDGLLGGLLADNELKSDLIHLNAKGYKQLAQGIAKRITVIKLK